MSHNLFNTLQEFRMASGKTGKFYSLPALEKALGAKVSRLPVSIRIVLESVLDHSVQIDHYGVKNALDLNMKLEFKRNQERYTFMKWAMQAFDTFRVVPPGIGIVHQVNLEYL